MTHLKESIGLALLCAAIPTGGWAQEPTVSMENYTSDVAVTSIGNYSVSQQIGAPFATAVQESGDARLYQGLFSVIAGAETSIDTGIAPTIFYDDADMAMRYDAALRQLQIIRPDFDSDAELVIVNIEGGMIDRIQLRDEVDAIDLSSLSAGTYMAGILSNNRFSKTLKFLVK